MNGFSVIMFIFSGLILLAGIYLFKGHKNEILLWKIPDISKTTTKEVKNIGKWTIIASIIPLMLGIIGLFLDI